MCEHWSCCWATLCLFSIIEFSIGTCRAWFAGVCACCSELLSNRVLMIAMNACAWCVTITVCQSLSDAELHLHTMPAYMSKFTATLTLYSLAHEPCNSSWHSTHMCLEPRLAILSQTSASLIYFNCNPTSLSLLFVADLGWMAASFKIYWQLSACSHTTEYQCWI